MFTLAETPSARRNTSVEVVALPGVGHEAIAIRSILEELGARVHLWTIGSPAELLGVLGRGREVARYLIICAHGVESGLVLGTYGPGVDVRLLDGAGVLSPREIRRHASLPETVVVNTACFGNDPAMADAFHTAGATAYIASPDGVATSVFVTLYFYEILRRDADPQTAHSRATSYDGQLGTWEYVVPERSIATD